MIPGSATPLFLSNQDAGYEIERSLRFNSGDSAYLNRTPSSAGNRKTWTWSGWVKIADVTAQQTIFAAAVDASNRVWLRFNVGVLEFQFEQGGATTNLYTNAVYRDPSAWYHIVVAVDTTQATASNRSKIYVNGVQVTSFSTEQYPAQNYETYVNAANLHRIGSTAWALAVFADSYMADIHFIDGQALAPTDFGEYDDNNVWQPKEYTFGTNPNNGTTWSNSVTSSTGSFYAGSGPSNLFNGSLGNGVDADTSDGSVTFTPASTITFSDQIRVYQVTSAVDFTLTDASNNTTTYSKAATAGGAWHTIATGGGTLKSLQCEPTASGYCNWRALEIDGYVLIDGAVDNSFHLPFSDNSSNAALGYDAAATQPAVAPKGGMDVVAYTGTGSAQSISGLGFEPDFVWIKSRSSASDHELYDSVRGATKRLFSSLTSAESIQSAGLTAFNPDGFTLGGHAGSGGSGTNYVAWAWKAGGAAVSNTDGTITSSVSANTDYGFSIVSYNSGSSSGNYTLGHGLNAAPKFIIHKTRSSGNWWVYHESVVDDMAKYLQLNSTNALATNSAAMWGAAAPTSSVFGVRVGDLIGTSQDAIAYCWSEVSGFSKFGSYTGNGSTTGPVATTGFKPRFVIIKNTSSTGNWRIYDTKRDSTNPNTEIIYANSSIAESTTSHPIDMLNDGFQIKGTHVDVNTSGNTYIYAAFADRPGNNWDVNNIVTNVGLTTSKTQFDVVTYTGNGSSQSIDSLAFQPDLVWLKGRSVAYSHQLYDSVRGVQEALVSDTTAAESTRSGGLTAFNSDGFTIGNDGGINNNNSTFVAWCWKAGGTAVSNTDGAVTASVSANAAYGFSIVKWTSTSTSGTESVGHGLGKRPGMVIFKERDRSSNWYVWHQSVCDADTKFLKLNSTDALQSGAGDVWGDLPTENVININNGSLNATGSDNIAYCFADVPGYQRIGSYTGNGSTTGPVIVTGFKPRFLLIKNASLSGSNWFIFDSQRSPSNPVKLNLKPNSSAVEETDSSGTVDFNENGFQIKSAGTHPNGSGNTIIYVAIADDEIGAAEDSLIDTPTNADTPTDTGVGNEVVGNYATLNPLFSDFFSSAPTYSNGNLDLTQSSDRTTFGTIAVSSGKWYWEISIASGTNQLFGITDTSEVVSGTTTYDKAGSYYYYPAVPRKYVNGSFSSYGSTVSVGDVVGIALDLDSGEITCYKNGVSQGVMASSLPTATYVPGFGAGNTTACTQNINFGQRAFAYTAPSGFKALCTANLTDPTIADGSTAMDVALYTGNGTSQSITGLGFSPDFVWIKNRQVARDHRLFDVVRGATQSLQSSLTAAEVTESTSLTAFTSDGFSLGSLTAVNESTKALVAWAWDAGTGSPVSNTDGSITSSVRANPSAGFSIVSYTGNGTAGATVGHGLNAKPDFLIVKNRDRAVNWVVYHSDVGATKYIPLNLTNAATTWSGFLNDTEPTSSVITLGNGSGPNHNGENIIIYAMSAVEGYSAFGSYTGNGSADGPFVFTGFRPRWVMVKVSSTTNSWVIIDSERDSYNIAGQRLRADLSNAEDTQDAVDFLSNGFKVRSATASAWNDSGQTYIYACFCEHPFKTARAR